MASKISLGLGRITRLLDKLDRPHRRFDTIHVAGTNGKGSVSAMIANTLHLAGLKTGLYTSPHLAYPRDTITIDGQIIPQVAYSAVEKQVKLNAEELLHEMAEEGAYESETTTTFEQMTAIAFEAFRREEVDIAVVEVGLGGTQDATNVLQPLISVITSIGKDHTALLGSDIRSIAEAKAGIIKPGVTVVATSDQDHGQVFGVLGKRQREVNGQRKIIWTPPNSTLDFRISNENTARQVLQELRNIRFSNGLQLSEHVLSDELIERGIKTAKWKGRCERLDLSNLRGPRNVLLDGAHNAESIEALANVLNSDGDMAGKRVFVFAMTAGKDAKLLARLMQAGDQFFAIEFEPVEGMDWIAPLSSQTIHTQLAGFGYQGRNLAGDVLGALRQSQQLLKHNGEVVICGSLYLVGQVHRMLQEALYEDAFGTGLVADTLGRYDAAKVEQCIQNYWQGLPAQNNAKLVSQPVADLLLPPPNVTGSLHLGHALTVAIQDAYARFYCSHGHSVSWIPGTDHAGIATQSVVSKQLTKSGVDVSTMPRNDLIEAIWRWREDFGSRINKQIRRLGTSLAWDREFFTMDSERSSAVVEAFKKLWDAGLVHRQKRMVNWSIKLQSVISDIEVDDMAVNGPTKLEGAEFGRMWRIRYASLDQAGVSVEVDTTRPETILGDRTLAVHPDDNRYSHLVGTSFQHPLLSSVSLRMIADDFVQPKFGTGCVKITPAHDLTDYAVSQRHKIEPIAVFDEKGKMLPCTEHPELDGIDRLEARARILSLLERHGSVTGSQPHQTTLKLCSRSGELIEPMLMPQWFIHMSPLAAEVLSRDDIVMTSKTRAEWRRWLSDTQDWCVSRQLVWGHRIPLFRVLDCDSQPTERWVFGRTVAEASANANGLGVVQDDDVLDTWFSSGILPLSAFGWPRNSRPDGYKLELIESGPDILFFWLARMAMLCTFLSGISPFKEIVLHPLIRDASGRKMSKSLGNVIDPISVIDGQSLSSMLEDLANGNLSAKEAKLALAHTRQTYPSGMTPAGADSLRFALVNSTIQSEELRFDMRSVVAARYLCTKLWNAVNFYNFHAKGLSENERDTNDERSHNVIDCWLEHRLRCLEKSYEAGFQARALSTSTERLRAFVVNDFCDIYLEFLKIDLRALNTVEDKMTRLSFCRQALEIVLQMVAVFMPHIAEYLWHVIGNKCSIHRQQLKTLNATESADATEVEDRVSLMQDILRHLRSVEGRKTLRATIFTTPAELDVLTFYVDHLQSLSGVASLALSCKHAPRPNQVLRAGTSITHSFQEGGTEVSRESLPGLSAKKMRKLDQLRVLVAGEEYTARVPMDIQQLHRSQIRELEAQLC